MIKINDRHMYFFASIAFRSTDVYFNSRMYICSYGSFFGPSQPVIAQRVIQESKSLLENPDLAAKIYKNSHKVHANICPFYVGCFL